MVRVRHRRRRYRRLLQPQFGVIQLIFQNQYTLMDLVYRGVELALQELLILLSQQAPLALRESSQPFLHCLQSKPQRVLLAQVGAGDTQHLRYLGVQLRNSLRDVMHFYLKVLAVRSLHNLLHLNQNLRLPERSRGADLQRACHIHLRDWS